MANMFNKVMSVISKRPEQRPEFEIQGLLPWFRKKSKLFATLKTDCLKDIVRNCGVRTFKRNEIIIRQGEIGDCFYIILEGKISIFIINKDKGKDEEGDEKSAFASIGQLNQDGELDRGKLGNFVTSLGSGFPFGEVALVSDDAIRTASIIAEEDHTDLLVVDRTLYNRAVRDVLAAEFTEKRDFIKENELFQTWMPKYRKQLAMAMYKETYPFDSVLVKQGESVANIYFIISGQVEIQTDTSLHPIQYPKLYKLLEDEREKMIKEKKKQRTEQETTTPPVHRKRENSKILKMCYLGLNESLGELEILMDMGTYMTSAICTEKTEVLVLEMKHYERLFVKRHQRTIDAMRRNFEVKLSTRTSVLKDRSEIMLLKLVQTQLHLIHNPPPAAAHEKKKKNENSVQIAEKLFFNHQGPLFDIDGPGSVFYMIRAREQSRLKLKAHQKDRAFRRENRTHVHTIRLPKSLMMAANLAGATELTDHSNLNVLNSNVTNVKSTQESVIDTVAQQNIPQHENGEDASRIKSAKSGKDNAIFDATVPKSFRRIQSAVRSKPETPLDPVKSPQSRSQDEYENKFTMRSRGILNMMNGNTDDTLGQLESKVEEWLRKDNPKMGTNVSKLRRIQVEEMEQRPKPGNTVVIRRRWKPSQSDSSTGTGSSEIIVEPQEKPRSVTPEITRTASTNTNYLEKYKILLTS